MDVVVSYRRLGGGAGRAVGVVLVVVGAVIALALGLGPLLGFRSPFHAYLPHMIAIGVGVLLGLVVVLAGVLVLAGAFAPKHTKIQAPRGVAWVLERGGVMVPLPGRDVRIPWSQVRFEPTTVAGRPGVRVVGPGVDQAYPGEGLSMGYEQIDAEARRIASGR